MKTREGIYFGNREIVERYIGGKLVWQKEKEILVFAGKAFLYPYENKINTITIIYSDGSISAISNFKTYTTQSSNGFEIKNPCLLINNKKYKNITITLEHEPNYYEHAKYVITLKFSSQIEYYEVLRQFPTPASFLVPVDIISIVKK